MAEASESNGTSSVLSTLPGAGHDWSISLKEKVIASTWKTPLAHRHTHRHTQIHLSIHIKIRIRK